MTFKTNKQTVQCHTNRSCKTTLWIQVCLFSSTAADTATSLFNEEWGDGSMDQIRNTWIKYKGVLQHSTRLLLLVGHHDRTHQHISEGNQKLVTLCRQVEITAVCEAQPIKITKTLRPAKSKVAALSGPESPEGFPSPLSSALLTRPQ